MAASVQAHPVPGHVGSKETYQHFVNSSRTNWFVQSKNMRIVTLTQVVAKAIKKCYVSSADIIAGRISDSISILRHLDKILPVVADFFKRPQMFDLFTVTRLNPATELSDGLGVFGDLGYWADGGPIQDFAKHRYFNLAAMVVVTTADLITHAFFMKSVALNICNLSTLTQSIGKFELWNTRSFNAVRGLNSETFEKIALYGYVGYFTLAFIQSATDQAKYSGKNEFYENPASASKIEMLAKDRFVKINNASIEEKAKRTEEQKFIYSNEEVFKRIYTERKIEKNAHKAHKASKNMCYELAKLACIVVPTILGFKNPILGAVLNTAGLIATARKSI